MLRGGAAVGHYGWLLPGVRLPGQDPYGAVTDTGTSSLSLPATRRTQFRMTCGSVGLVSSETAT
jgi:hypothetical protein